MPAQRVILYDREGLTYVYDSAYTDEQVRVAIVRCAERHGRQANVRSIDADKYPPQGRHAA